MKLETDNSKSSRSETWVRRLLLGIGVVTLFASVAVVMPHRWMAALHGGLGLGLLSDTPITDYLARSLSAFYVIFGAMFCFMGRRVMDHVPLIQFISKIGIGFAVVVTGICLKSGLPWWWTLSEVLFLFSYFSILGYWARRLPG